MKIGIIGDDNHSKRIQKIIKKIKLNFYIYKPKGPKYFEKEKFNQLKKCNVIFIISPNNTHYLYIQKLYKGRFIFCEKPPVNNKNEYNGIIIGQVLGIHIQDDYILNGIIDVKKLKPLARLGYMDYSIVDSFFQMNRPRQK